MRKSFLVLGIISLGVGLFLNLFNIEDNGISLKEEKGIKEIERILGEVKTSNNLDSLNKAKEIFDDYEVTNSEVLANITNLEFKINKDNLLKEYEEKIKVLETSLNEEETNKLKEEIKTIKYEDVKNTLLEKEKVIEEKIAIKKEEERKRREAEERARQEAAFKAMDGPVNSRDPGFPVIETLVGNLSAYASGSYRASGKVHYEDKDFGTVYVVAGDPKYPKGTIVRLKNVGYFGKTVYAIVLDRGGAIGIGRAYLFDVLFGSVENMHHFGIQRNVTCEIVRWGY